MIARINVLPIMLLIVPGLMLTTSMTVCAQQPSITEQSIADRLRQGQLIYEAKCVSCHGARGEGTESVKQPLYGDRATSDLADVIDRTMPEGSPEECVGEDARMVAEWMQNAFYSPEAQARINPPRLSLTRLTVSQYRNSVADLSTSFRWNARHGEFHGLKAEYYASRNTRRDRRVIERVDPFVDFQYGTLSPDGEKIPEDEFSARWNGSIIINETGWYEFILNSENGARLFVNDSKTPLIDVWVRSGPETEFRASRFLLAGRLYPVVLEWFKFKEKSASISLKWKPPQGIADVIPTENLSTAPSPQVLVVETPFPPDDRSSGFERGSGVSQEWDDATTYAALEAAEKFVQLMPSLVEGSERNGRGRGRQKDESQNAEPDEHRARVRQFAVDLVERAFRRPLSDEQKQICVDSHFSETQSEDDAIRRIVLLALKSPQFLYREPLGRGDQFDTASRLSFSLLNSIPDQNLLEAAGNGQLATPEQIREQAWRIVGDPRTQSRLHEFLRSWMNLERIHGIDKNHELYPDFTPELAADLRSSLELGMLKVVASQDPRLSDLLLNDRIFMNPRIAEFYGVPAPSVSGFAETPFESDRRSGILTHPYLLSGFAYHSTSSPIHRGVFVSRGILGRALKAPPVAVAPTAPELAPEMTTRERVVLQTSPDQCVRCHNMINSLGFPLEHFDAVGRYRDEEKGKPIDATGIYVTRAGTDARFSNAKELAKYLAESDETYRSFARQLFHHQVQQPIMAFGPSTLSELGQYFEDHEGRIRPLMVEIATRAATWVEPESSKSSVAESSEVGP